MTLNSTVRKFCCSWLFPNEFGVYGLAMKVGKYMDSKIQFDLKKTFVNLQATTVSMSSSEEVHILLARKFDCTETMQ